MHQTSQFGIKDSRISHGRWRLFALLLCAAAHTAQAQSGSLAEAARQVRAEKQSQPDETSKAQQIANELSEDQNQKGVAGGFKLYDAGAYKLTLPAPYSMSGHDEGGTVISGPRVGTVVPLTLVGNSIILQGDTDDAFRDASVQFARNYAQSANCTQTTVANHNAYQCMLAGANLAGRSVGGTALFLRDARNLYPLFCVATTDSNARDVLNNQYASYLQKMHARQVLAQETEYATEVWQKCDTVFQSIHFVHGGQPPRTMSARADARPVANVSDRGKAAGSPSLAAPDPQSHPSPQTTQTVPLSLTSSTQTSVPSGFKAQPFTYCKSPNNCWDASVLVPSEARLVSSDCKQYIFELTVKGSPLLLLAGPAGGEGCSNNSQGDPNRVRWNELAEPENRRATGTYSTIGTMQATLDGKRAIITQIGFRKDLTSWIGKRAEIENNGVPLFVGCMAPRDTFEDVDAICSSWIGSLRLP